MSAIGKGDWVQCIHAPRLSGLVVEGGVYSVQSVGVPPPRSRCWRCSGTEEALFLAHDGACSRGYCPCHFKPLGGNAQAVERTAPAELEPA